MKRPRESPEPPALEIALHRFRKQDRDDPVLAILGPSGSGKTELLRALVRRLSENGDKRRLHPLVIDLREIAIDSEERTYAQVVARLLASADETKLELKTGARGLSSANKLESLIVAAALRVNGDLLLAIDHLESVPRSFAEDLAQRLQGLKESTAQENVPGGGESVIVSPRVSQMSMVVTGCLSLHALTTSEKSAFHLAEIIAMPVGHPAQARKYVRHHFARKGMRIADEDVLQTIVEFTAAETCFVEAAARQLARQNGMNSVELVKSALESIDSKDLPHLEHMALRLAQDGKLRDMIVRLSKDQIVPFRGMQSDIDEYQLTGTVVLDKAGTIPTYRFRNGIVKCNVQAILSRNVNAEPELLRAIKDLKEGADYIAKARDLGVCLGVLQSVWSRTTGRVNPLVHMAFASRQSNKPEFLQIAVREGDVPLSVRLAVERGVSNVGVVFGLDEKLISVAAPVATGEVKVWVIATIPRENTSLNEYLLEHWLRFLAKVAGRLAELGLIELSRWRLTAPARPEKAAVSSDPRITSHLFLLDKIIIDRPWEVQCLKDLLDEKETARAREGANEVLETSDDQKSFDRQLEQIGSHLTYALNPTPELAQMLKDEPERQNWVISSSVKELQLPLELLPVGRDQLLLRSGVARRLEGSQFRPPAALRSTFARLFSQLKQAGQPFRALLVGADPDGELPVDIELDEVKEKIRAGVLNLGIPAPNVQIEVISGRQAKAKKIQDTLRDARPFHIFHFCGHGILTPQSSKQACIRLVNERGLADDVGSDQLKAWLHGAGIWLCVMSSCRSGAIAGDGLLRSGGLLDDVVSAGIPNFLGFRWPVSAESARMLVTRFYERLLEPPGTTDLSTALLDARLTARGAKKFGDAWASSLLITQCGG